MKWTIFQLFVLVELSVSLVPKEILLYILSQSDQYHLELAQDLRTKIYNQSILLDKENVVNIQILHEAIDHPGYWTFLAILPELSSTIEADIKWVIVCEDKSFVQLEILLEGLSTWNHTQDVFLGHPIYDKEATIIHHFAFFEKPQWFPYPLIRSGIAFSLPLIKKLAKYVEREKPTSDFFIDSSHELSLFIYHHVKSESHKITTGNKKLSKLGDIHPDGQKEINNNDARTIPVGNNQDTTKLYKRNEHKLLMAAAPYFCAMKEYGCAVHPNQLVVETASGTSTSTCKPISAETIYFAIKTYHEFHKERIPIIERTWGQYAVHKRYFSDIHDKIIPTVATGIPNTETGHCGKTLLIFSMVLKDIKMMNRNLKRPIKWIFLCDDDTLLSVARVCDILGCHNATKHIYLGERYGYRLHSKDGFNYITGGGGMALSIPTVEKIVKTCSCPSISSPDDMIIGVCLQRQGINAIHSARFHQARPPDYSSKLLALEPPISFHKFWQVDPIRIYNKWFKKADHEFLQSKSKPKCDINSSQSTKFESKNGAENELNIKQLKSHVEL